MWWADGCRAPTRHNRARACGGLALLSRRRCLRRRRALRMDGFCTRDRRRARPPPGKSGLSHLDAAHPAGHYAEEPTPDWRTRRRACVAVAMALQATIYTFNI